MFGIGIAVKLREADRVQALILERAKELKETVLSLTEKTYGTPVLEDASIHDISNPCVIPPIGNGKRKISSEQIEKCLASINHGKDQVSWMVRVLPHTEKRNVANQ